MTDELKQWEYDKGYAKGQIDILEKIKAEIGEAYPYFDSADVHWGFNICRDIIENHIAGLKGENSEESYPFELPNNLTKEKDEAFKTIRNACDRTLNELKGENND